MQRDERVVSDDSPENPFQECVPATGNARAGEQMCPVDTPEKLPGSKGDAAGDGHAPRLGDCSVVSAE